MRMRIAALVGALVAAPALAQPPAAACPNPVDLPALAPWRAASAAKPHVGVAAQVALEPAGTVAYDMTPLKPPGPGSYAGVFHFGVAKAGVYRIAVSRPVWIDVVRDTKPVASVAHAHGPECRGIAKIVDFALKPGTQALQITGATEPGLTVMIVAAG